jgi:F-type H+-transporting ATPase subunit epsilon
MNITVLTPDKEIFNGSVTSVKVPGTQGAFQILKNHAPIVSSLENGKITIVTGSGEYRYFDDETGQIETDQEPGQRLTFSINGGFVEVLDNEVSLLVTGVE